MSRFLLCAALAAVLAMLLVGRFSRTSLYEGRVIRLPDGTCYELLSRDPYAEGYWQVRQGRVIFSIDADDLHAALRGEFPPRWMPREGSPAAESAQAARGLTR